MKKNLNFILQHALGIALFYGSAVTALAQTVLVPMDPVAARVPKYVIPLMIPPEMPRSGAPSDCLGTTCPKTDYNIAVRQFQQQILPGGLWNSFNGRNDAFAPTTVWGYGLATDPIPNGYSAGGRLVQAVGVAPVPVTQSSYNYPSNTFEVASQTTTSVRWINELVTINAATGKPWPQLSPNRKALPHLLAVDRTLHFANPERLPCINEATGVLISNSTDCTPYADPVKPNPLLAKPYDGPVPMVVHVHGSEADPYSDGFAESWWLPSGRTAKGGFVATSYASRGSHYDQAPTLRSNLYPGSAAYAYQNIQPATTAWYHDHTLGMTANNVYAGPVGFYLLRGSFKRADGVVVADKPVSGVLPGASSPLARPTHPIQKYKLANGKSQAGCDPNFDAVCRANIREIPLALQDRSFNADGSLFYPTTRAYFDGFTAPYLAEPGSDVPPIHNPEFFGNAIVVNGAVWPSLNVVPQRYRLRVLAGADSRFFNLSLWALPPGTALDDLAPDYADRVRALGREIPFYQIGAEQGFLPKVAKIQTGVSVALPGNGTNPAVTCAPGADPADPACERGLLMAPAERADVIVDFTGLPPGTLVQMLNIAPDVPFNSFPLATADLANPASTMQVMRFVVTAPTPSTPKDPSTPVASLQLSSEPGPVGAPLRTLRTALAEEDSAQVCVQVDLTGAITGTSTFPQRQPDPMAACATRDAVPFGPTVTIMGTVDPQSGAPVREMWADPVTLAPVIGEDNLYEIVNYTVDSHPMHLHGTRFKVVERQALATNPDGSVALPLTPVGSPVPPAVNEAGFKDTVNAPPAMVTRIRAAFAQPGLYQFHCHIVEHEDNEMMIPVCAKATASDTACTATPGGVPWPIVNNGAGVP